MDNQFYDVYDFLNEEDKIHNRVMNEMRPGDAICVENHMQTGLPYRHSRDFIRVYITISDHETIIISDKCHTFTNLSMLGHNIFSDLRWTNRILRLIQMVHFPKYHVSIRESSPIEIEAFTREEWLACVRCLFNIISIIHEFAKLLGPTPSMEETRNDNNP